MSVLQTPLVTSMPTVPTPMDPTHVHVEMASREMDWSASRQVCALRKYNVTPPLLTLPLFCLIDDVSSDAVGLSVGLAIAGAVVLLCVSTLLLTMYLRKRSRRHLSRKRYIVPVKEGQLELHEAHVPRANNTIKCS